MTLTLTIRLNTSLSSYTHNLAWVISRAVEHILDRPIPSAWDVDLRDPDGEVVGEMRVEGA